MVVDAVVVVVDVFLVGSVDAVVAVAVVVVAVAVAIAGDCLSES